MALVGGATGSRGALTINSVYAGMFKPILWRPQSWTGKPPFQAASAWYRRNRTRIARGFLPFSKRRALHYITTCNISTISIFEDS